MPDWGWGFLGGLSLAAILAIAVRMYESWRWARFWERGR